MSYRTLQVVEFLQQIPISATVCQQPPENQWSAARESRFLPQLRGMNGPSRVELWLLLLLGLAARVVGVTSAPRRTLSSHSINRTWLAYGPHLKHHKPPRDDVPSIVFPPSVIPFSCARSCASAHGENTERGDEKCDFAVRARPVLGLMAIVGAKVPPVAWFHKGKDAAWVARLPPTFVLHCFRQKLLRAAADKKKYTSRPSPLREKRLEHLMSTTFCPRGRKMYSFFTGIPTLRGACWEIFSIRPRA